MANTVIQLRNSTVTGNVPSSLANGEISINSRDGKFFYSTPTGAVITHYPYLGPAGLNKEIQFNDSGTLGANAGLSFDKSSGIFSTKLISVTNSVGDEGGEILLAKPSTNTTLVGTGITIDAFQNKIRFFEQGGSARGAYIDLTECVGGAGTNLLNPTSTPDTVARNTANAAFIQANASFLQANTPSATANSAASYANSAFLRANTPSATANSAALYANAAFTRANNSLDANNGGTVTGTITATSFITTGSFGNIQGANTIYANNFVANTGFIQFADGSKQYTANAGSGGGTDTFARNQANAAFIHANAAFDVANTGGGGGANSFGQIVANVGTILATSSNDSLQIVGESGISVSSNVSAKKVIVSVPAGFTFTTADYGFVTDSTNVIYDYGTI